MDALPAGAGHGPLLAPPLVRALAFLGFAAGVLLALPHLADPVWQDEAYTVITFADKGFWYPFTDYHLPNNHVLFSALLALWEEPGDAVAQARLLPLAFFAASLVVLYLAVARLAGAPAAILALVLFATSPVTRDFAAQLRGYSLSWLALGVLLLATPRWAKEGHVASGVAYALAAAASVAILPSNFWFCVAFMLWGGVLCLADRQASRTQRALRASLLLWAPLAGFLAYAAVWFQLLSAATRPWGGWPYGETVAHWARATLASYGWLVPIAAAGLAVLARRAWAAAPDAAARSQLLFVAGLAGALCLMAAVIPYPPFPRTFVPALPLWYAAVAMLAAAPWSLPAVVARRRLAAGAFVVAAFAVVLSASLRPPCGGDAPAGEFPQDLCHSFYHRDYRPDLLVAALGELARTQAVFVVADDEAFWALSFLVRQRGVRFPLEVVSERDWREERLRGVATRDPGLVVTRSRDALAEMLAKAGLAPDRYRAIADTGYFKVYAGGN